MKASTLASDRTESRLKPQTPCPLVQPLPIRTPMLTSSPAAITAGQPASTRATGSGANSHQIHGAVISPAKNSQRTALLPKPCPPQQSLQRADDDPGYPSNAAVAQHE